jgi:hypothetical protein
MLLPICVLHHIFTQASAAPEQPATQQPPEQHPAPQAAATMAGVVKAAIVAIRVNKDSSEAEPSATAAPCDASDTKNTRQQKQQQWRKLAGNQSPAQHLKANMKQAGTSKPSFSRAVKALTATAADSKVHLKGSREVKAAAAAASGASQAGKAKAATKFKVTAGAGKIKVLYRGT